MQAFAIILFAIVLANNSFAKNVFKVIKGGTALEVNGEISSSSLADFEKLHNKYPNIKTISIKSCEGSIDDKTNFALMKRIRDLNLNTHLEDNGVIASGGVDLFLAGELRTRGKNTKIGVHSWDDDDNEEATDFPVGHKNHMPYIKAYMSIGFDKKKAEELYYFIIRAASADSIHWMTELELSKFKFFLPESSAPAPANIPTAEAAAH